jgi:hypothetical protein
MMKTARPDRVSVTRRVAASPRAVWLIVCDPARHVDIDSSGMLQVAPDVRPLTRPARPSTWTWTAVPRKAGRPAARNRPALAGGSRPMVDVGPSPTGEASTASSRTDRIQKCLVISPI